MRISTRNLAPVMAQRRPPAAEALETLVPGEYPQVEKDLASFPVPVLNLLDDYGVRVAVLDEGQTLADSPALRTLTAQEYESQRSLANTLLRKALTEGISDPDKLTRRLRSQGLAFHLGLMRRPLPPSEIAARRGIPEEHRQDWSIAFEELNRGLPQSLIILPHTYYRGHPIAESHLRNAGEVSAEYVEKSLGLNRPQERMVLLHQKFVGQPAAELDNYRLAIHEMGHALDYVLDRLTAVPGFGAVHRQTVDTLFEADQKRVEQGHHPEQVFTSDRADDDVREYFAEAVEAYLTKPLPGDKFRAENSNPSLQFKNPALYNYIDQIMTTEFPAGVAPPPPAPKLLPDWVPDRDNEVISIS